MITPIGHDRVSRARRRLQIARLRVAAFPEEGAVPAIGCKDLFPLIRVSNVSAFFIFYRLWFWSYSEVGEISPPVSEFYPYYFNSGCGVFTDLVIFSDFRGTRLFHHTPAPQRSDRHVPCYPRGGWEFRRFAIPTGGKLRPQEVATQYPLGYWRAAILLSSPTTKWAYNTLTNAKTRFKTEKFRHNARLMRLKYRMSSFAIWMRCLYKYGARE